MAKKLIKVAKQINIGLSTIVDFLSDNGFEIEAKPTAKISDDMYDLLMQRYSSSAEVKEKANNMLMRNKNQASEETDPVTETVVDPAVETVADPVVKTVPDPVVETVTDPVVETVTETVADPAVETVADPVVETAADPVVDSDAPKAEPITPTKEEVKETTIEEEPKIGLKVKGKIDLAKFNKPKKKEVAIKKEKTNLKPKKQIPKKTTPSIEKKDKYVSNNTIKTPEIIDVEGQIINKGIKSESEELIRANTPTLKGLKIKGKIDIEKLDQSTKPKKQAKTDSKDKPKPAESRNRRKRTRTTRRVSPSTYTPKSRYKGKSKRTKDEVKEVSKKEIEDQIKATMARLSGGGKGKRQKIRREIRESKKEKQELQELDKVETTLKVTEFITVSEFASLMDVSATDVITTCMNLGVFVSINQRLDAEIIELVASEFEHEVEFISAEETGIEEEEILDNPEDLIPRAPIVTIMGHVDHGKTSLLDYIREANVAEGEAGGITQHIGAYKVSTTVGGVSKEITFLDTPGHEAFTAMRARGAKVTDIAIIIIAADDKIMPQTKEAISHSQAAGVPMIFAINKIDKDGASPERIKQELASMNLLVEEWGGKYQSQDISAKNGVNIDLLLEKIVLESEMLELKANPKASATGTIIEASLDKGRGYTANILVKNGTLKVGDPMSVGNFHGKVKALLNQKNSRIKSAGPSTPVMVLGLNGAPQAGEVVKVYKSEQEAKSIAHRREQLSREQSLRTTKRISLEEIGRRLALGTFKELNLIIKGDVDGSVEALTDSLEKLSVETVSVNIIHKAVGPIIESDVLLAAASDAIIIGFQVRPTAGVRNLAEKEEVQIKTYSIIYEAIEDIRDAIEGMLEPTKEEKILAQVRVQEIYKISKVGTIAGCIVEDGKISRNNFVRIIRDGIVVYPNKEGQIAEMSSLKRFKDDVKDVRSGMECGISIKNYNDIKVDDLIEAYEIIEIEQKLK